MAGSSPPLNVSKYDFEMNEMNQIEVDKIGSATSPLNLPRRLSIVDANGAARAGDVVIVRVLTDNATYNMLELPTGRLAKLNPGDLLAGVIYLSLYLK